MGIPFIPFSIDIIEFCVAFQDFNNPLFVDVGTPAVLSANIAAVVLPDDDCPFKARNNVFKSVCFPSK